MNNALDKVIEYFSPRAAAKRAHARLVVKELRKFEAGTHGRRNGATSAASASAESQAGLVWVIRNSRDLMYNNGWAKRIQTVVANNTIGTGIVGTIKGGTKGRNKVVQGMFDEWCKSNDFDAHRMGNMAMKQTQSMQAVVESGGVIHVKVIDRSLKFPLCIKTLEVDHFDTTRDAVLTDGGRIIEGIEYDQQGRIKGAWLYKNHPGDRIMFGNYYLQSEFVPASSFIHLYRPDRVGQGRGLPWIHPVATDLRELNDYQYNQNLRQKLAACFVGFIHDIDGSSDGAGAPTAISDKLTPGNLEILPNGRTITFNQPPPVTGYGEHLREGLQKIAVGTGITYEALTGNLKNTSFSSGRLGYLEFHRNVSAWQWNMVVPMMLDPMARWFFEMCEIMGVDTQGMYIEWTTPRREMIDPTKEIPAIIKMIRGGLLSLSEAQRMFGFNPMELMKEYIEDNKFMDENGLVFDSDPRRTSQQGQMQVTQADGDIADDMTDDDETEKDDDTITA